MQHMDASQRTLFVHNTLTTSEDIAAAHQWSNEVYWATCPNANLYIENTLPPIDLLLNHICKIVVGTDSYGCNWQLIFAALLKTLLRYFVTKTK